MTYSNTSEIWNWLGKDAKTKVRGEIVGTSSTTASTNYELDHDNVIASSLVVYTNSATLTSSAYTENLNDGKITALTGAASGSVITADYDYADLPDSIISQMITSSDSEIDEDLGRSFANNAGTVEYLDVEFGQKTFFLKNYPVLTLTSVERNIAGSETITPDWETLTSGLGNDYIANSDDLANGRIRCIDNFPYEGHDSLRVTYNHGYTSTPSRVNELSILLTLRKLVQSAVYKSIFKGNDNFTPVRTNEIEERINDLKRQLKKNSISLI